MFRKRSQKITKAYVSGLSHVRAVGQIGQEQFLRPHISFGLFKRQQTKVLARVVSCFPESTPLPRC